MIEEIAIRDLGVIADATLPLGPGFTAVTGETGAGKTMVVTALGLLLGARADSRAVRREAGTAWVEGRWRLPREAEVLDRVRDAGGDVDVDDVGADLVLGRSVSAEGRSRAVVGGRGAPVGVLSEVGGRLVVVHGQSDQLRLTSAVAQRDALDRFGGAPLAAALEDYRALRDAWSRELGELERLTRDRDDRSREAEALRDALADIERVAPRAGELEELDALAERLTHLDELRRSALEAHESLSAETLDALDATALVDRARRLVERGEGLDASLAPVGETIRSAAAAVADAAAELTGYLGSIETEDPGRLERVQERRAELTGLERRRGSLEEVLETAGSGALRLAELEGDDDRIAELGAATAALEREVRDAAARLTRERRAAADELGERVTEELAALAMGGAVLAVRVEDRGRLGASGADEVTLALAAHPGAEPQPVARAASGGELSRVMLALEVVLAATEPVPTLVFDEIDAGVGGAAAIEIGRRLARLARDAQVVVVTHLAQVAAFAGNHLAVVKESSATVTSSDVRALAGEERVAEMARLLSGLPDSDSGLAHARELLALAREAAGEGAA